VYHALHRGNNRARVFVHDADFQPFRAALAQTKARDPFRRYGSCLMRNHLHLVLEPGPGQALCRLVPWLTVAHAGPYHQEQATAGHVGQGRFQSPVVARDEH
jgi:REP element-mobilizing transposase RayT